jgi:hypothetical protein
VWTDGEIYSAAGEIADRIKASTAAAADNGTLSFHGSLVKNVRCIIPYKLLVGLLHFTTEISKNLVNILI